MKIDVFHDTACPWCRIGSQHLKAALAQWESDPVTVQYHPFFLNADIPPGGYAFGDYMAAKGGGQVPIEQWFAAPRMMGQRAGLTFNFEQIERAPNTLLSHQLIALVSEAQREGLIDAIYAAYFEFGRDIGSLDILVDISSEQGFNADTIREQLQQGQKRDAVLADAAQARHIGISGVPFFIFDGRLAFSGAQPSDVILDVMRQTSHLTQEEKMKS